MISINHFQLGWCPCGRNANMCRTVDLLKNTRLCMQQADRRHRQDMSSSRSRYSRRSRSPMHERYLGRRPLSRERRSFSSNSWPSPISPSTRASAGLTPAPAPVGIDISLPQCSIDQLSISDHSIPWTSSKMTWKRNS